MALSANVSQSITRNCDTESARMKNKSKPWSLCAILLLANLLSTDLIAQPALNYGIPARDKLSLTMDSEFLSDEMPILVDSSNKTISTLGNLTVVEELSTGDLLSWSRWGNGYVGSFRNRAVQMTESAHSEGVMLISPESYGTEVEVSFDVMTLRPATVLVLMLSISSDDGSGSFTMPPDFDGAMSGWPPGATSYFFAFHNAPHFRHPFINRWGPEGVQLLQEAGENHMTPGEWHSVEAGRSGGRLWLRIDGQVVLYVTDPEPFGPGHIAFRIRGSGTEIASCFIKDVRIRSADP